VSQLPPALSRGSVEQGRVSHADLEEAKRERVLVAMTDVFAKRGYPAATVDHLIAGAKISMGGFYNCFEGKEDCFIQVYERVADLAYEQIRAAVPPGSDWSGKVVTGLRALLMFVADRPLAARIVLLEAQTSGPAALRRYNESMKQVSAFLREGRSAGGAAKKLPKNFEDATASGLIWLLQRRVSRGDLGDVEELYPQMAKVVLEPYLGSDGARRALQAATGKPALPS
jgi:AcrR family transcriptional regulator